MAKYICYDIKGIQNFIFSIPRLKCMIGASSYIAEFDSAAEHVGHSHGAQWVFAGGGRGAFFCSDEQNIKPLIKALVDRAAKHALDLCIGVDSDFSQAIHGADRFYPFCPDSFEGYPCAMSALWPVREGAGRKWEEGWIHDLVWKRAMHGKDDELWTGRLRSRDWSTSQIFDLANAYQLKFMKNVNPEEDDDGQRERDRQVATAGLRSLGSRNRWAVVAMDGNDMGRQFRDLENRKQAEGWTDEVMTKHLREMSKTLRNCTEGAFWKALGQAIAAWADDVDDLSKFQVPAGIAAKPELILPFRPLILGGDDVILLCHSAHAMRFVRDMAKEFGDLSSQHGALWPATDGRLTISAGVLYCKVTFPLHMAIPYAESLLASAKGRYRKTEKEDEPQRSREPTPAAVDWEAITDTLVDTPAARRNRDLRFDDQETGLRMQLTRRPYLLESRGTDEPDLPSLEILKDQLVGKAEEGQGVPTSVRAGILPALKRPWSERIAYVASLSKRHPRLKELLWEDKPIGKAWCERTDKEGHQVRETGLPDALLLLEEERRMKQKTAER